jgi:putative acetyltransferase
MIGRDCPSSRSTPQRSCQWAKPARQGRKRASRAAIDSENGVGTLPPQQSRPPCPPFFLIPESLAVIASSHKHAVLAPPYRAGDVSSLITLFHASVRNIARADYADPQIKAWAGDFIDRAPFGQRCVEKSTWVAEPDDRAAGFCDIEPDAHIDMLYVHPDFQRRGVARALLAHIDNFAQQRGLVRLHTEASMTARPVFELRGFHVLAEQTVTVRGESLTNVRMEKWLDGRRSRQ